MMENGNETHKQRYLRDNKIKFVLGIDSIEQLIVGSTDWSYLLKTENGHIEKDLKVLCTQI